MTQKRIVTKFVRCECGKKHPTLLPHPHGEQLECKCGAVLVIDYKYSKDGHWVLDQSERIPPDDLRGAVLATLLRRGQN